MTIADEIAQFRRTQREAAGGSAIVVAGDRLFRHLRREFAVRFARHLYRPALIPHLPMCAIWLNPQGEVANVRVVAYLRPCWHDPNQPLTTRIAINYFRPHPSKANVRRLGRDPSQPAGCATDRPRMELSTRPEELLDFAVWVAALVESHESGADLPEPPYPCDFCGGNVKQSSYGWTCAADKEAWAYQEKQEEIRQRQLARWRESNAKGVAR
jgi:hypothetical protein